MTQVMYCFVTGYVLFVTGDVLFVTGDVLFVTRSGDTIIRLHNRSWTGKFSRIKAKVTPQILKSRKDEHLLLQAFCAAKTP